MVLCWSSGVGTSAYEVAVVSPSGEAHPAIGIQAAEVRCMILFWKAQR